MLSDTFNCHAWIKTNFNGHPACSLILSTASSVVREGERERGGGVGGEGGGREGGGREGGTDGRTH